MGGVKVSNFAFRLQYKVFPALLLSCSFVIALFSRMYSARKCYPTVTSAYLFCFGRYDWKEQNVAAMLFFQGLTFWLTYLMWRYCEKNEMKSFVEKEELGELSNELLLRRPTLRKWTRNLIFCEFLNVLTVVLQVSIMNWQLYGRFFTLGLKALHPSNGVLSELFPKHEMCSFVDRNVGVRDTVCALPLHACYETVFLVLWFLMVSLGFVASTVLVWRLLSLVLNAWSPSFLRTMLQISCRKTLSEETVCKLKSRFHYADWLFLRYLGKNIGPEKFYSLLEMLADENAENEKRVLKLSSLQ